MRQLTQATYTEVDHAEARRRQLATARRLYAVPLVALRPAQWDTLNTDHRSVVRRLYGLPRTSPVGPTLAEAVAPRSDSSASPATGVHRVRSVRRRKPSSTSCCSALATMTSAVSSSVFTAAWDFHT
ncbi:hypothetical protein MTO96_042825 [Rhipicephalus appendiculatus]